MIPHISRHHQMPAKKKKKKNNLNQPAQDFFFLYLLSCEIPNDLSPESGYVKDGYVLYGSPPHRKEEGEKKHTSTGCKIAIVNRKRN